MAHSSSIVNSFLLCLSTSEESNDIAAPIIIGSFLAKSRHPAIAHGSTQTTETHWNTNNQHMCNTTCIAFNVPSRLCFWISFTIWLFCVWYRTSWISSSQALSQIHCSSVPLHSLECNKWFKHKLHIGPVLKKIKSLKNIPTCTYVSIQSNILTSITD